MPRVRVKRVPGQPQSTNLRRNWTRVVDAFPFRKRSMRTLIKQDEAKGRTLPEFGRITDQPGVDTGGAKTAGVRRQKPQVPVSQSAGYAGRVRKAVSGPLRKR